MTFFTKKLLILFLVMLFSMSLSSCDYIFNLDKNTTVYYGIVKETEFGLYAEIPTIGLCEIPHAERIFSNFKDEPTQEDYPLQDGNLICISFIRPKKGVKVMKSHPAKFSETATQIAVLEEFLKLDNTENGIVLTQNNRKELFDCTIGDTIYFIDVGGYNGRAYVTLVCSGIITQINDEKVSMLLSLENYSDKIVEFLSLYHQLEQTTKSPLA